MNKLTKRKMFNVKFSVLIVILLQLLPESCAKASIDSNEINHNRFNRNYCAPGLCPTYKQHIGCTNKGDFGYLCPADAEVVELSDYYKRLILHHHNMYRSRIAEGNVPGYEPASRMGALQWDEELAYLGELNAMSCEIEHDECRNTKKYSFAGQNLALGYLLDDYTVDWAIKNFTAEWFIEYQDTNMNVINRYTRQSGPPIGHFTMMVNDKQTKVGCGYVKFSKWMNNYKYIVHVLSCNYSWTNVITYPVYKTGRTVSKCTTGKHYYYNGLCSDNEPIKSNFY